MQHSESSDMWIVGLKGLVARKGSLSLSCFSIGGDRVDVGNDATQSAFRLD